MKKIAILALTVVFGLSGVYAGCGVKVDITGKLEKIDVEKKELTIMVKGEEKARVITLEATHVTLDAKGGTIELAKLEGKNVTVSTDKHTAKAEKITLVAGKKAKA